MMSTRAGGPQKAWHPRNTLDFLAPAAQTYQEQAFKILDRERTVVRYNSEWLDKLGTVGLIELSAKYTVARMLERDDLSWRFAEQLPIHVHELMYPLLQGYDSVALDCDIELGGTDQLFNLLVGRDLMPRYGLRPQMVMTTPLLEGTDARVVDGKVTGKKMAKSAENYVGITEPPFELQMLMLVDDLVIWRYMDLLSARTNDEIAALRADVATGRAGILAVKEAFATEIVTRLHSPDAAAEALARRRSVAKGGLPDHIDEVTLHAADRPGVRLADAMKDTGLAESTTKAMQLIRSGDVHVGEDALPAEATKRSPGDCRYGGGCDAPDATVDGIGWTLRVSG